MAYEHYQRMLGLDSGDESDEDSSKHAASGSKHGAKQNDSTSVSVSKEGETRAAVIQQVSAPADEFSLDITPITSGFNDFFNVSGSICCSKRTGVTVRVPVRDRPIIELDLNTMALYFYEEEIVAYSCYHKAVNQFETGQEYYFDGEALNFMRRLIGGYLHFLFRSQEKNMDASHREHFVLRNDGNILELNRKISNRIKANLSDLQTASLFKLSRGAIMNRIGICSTLFIFEYQMNVIIRDLQVNSPELSWLKMPEKFGAIDGVAKKEEFTWNDDVIRLTPVEQLKSQKIYMSISQIEREERRAKKKKPRGTPSAFWFYQPREVKFKCIE